MDDFIVVGSGCTGAMAAQTLLEEGACLTMLDVGFSDKKYSVIIPDTDFVSIRNTDEQQHRYFLGDDFEGIPWGPVKTGAQLTPPRRFVVERVPELLPLDSQSFAPMESLAYGGLGSTWGLGCSVFSDREMEKAGLDKDTMHEAYQVVASRIGISAEKDDASPYTIGILSGYLPSMDIDSSSQKLLQKYLARKDSINREGFVLGKPALALLTQDKSGRKKVSYNDLDFYSDKEQAAWRPWMTVEQLKKQSNFRYLGNHLVLRFAEQLDGVEVKCLNLVTNETVVHHCKKLVLAGSTLGTARIVLRSFPREEHRLPLLCNTYSYVPSLHLRMLGKGMDQKRTGFAQLVMAYDPDGENSDVSIASIYTYRALLLFRIVKEAPLSFSDARIIMQYLLPAITIWGIHHPEEPTPSKCLWLEKDASSPTGDKLKAEYMLSPEERSRFTQRDKQFARIMRKLGCWALRHVDPGQGSSIHYAGTLPFSKRDLPYTIHPTGRLNGTRSVFVADGSGFRYLPAKGPTFSLMANAHCVAKEVMGNPAGMSLA
jgi:hypothetical protein